MFNPMNFYTIKAITQRASHSDTNSTVRMRLWGTKGRSQFIKIDKSGNDFEKGDNDNYNIKGFGNLGNVFRIDIQVGSDGWRPDEIVIRYNENGYRSRFTNYTNKIIDSEIYTMYADNLVSIDMQDNQVSHKEAIWYGFDYRESNTSQSIDKSQSTTMITKIANDSEHNLAVETGFTLTNESSVESGTEFGPKVKSSIKAEFYAKMAAEIKKSVHLEKTAEFVDNTSLTFTVPASTLLLVKYEIDTESKLGELTFFDGSKQKIVVPVYDKWSLSEIPKERIEITSDSQMTQEYKDLYKEVFGKEWQSKPYAQSAA